MKMPEFDVAPQRAAAPPTVLSVRAVQGFTLLELLVVMVIIGLLAGYVGPRYFAQIGKSEIKLARAQIDALEKSLDQFRLETGHYHSPLMDGGLATFKEAQLQF